MCVEGGRGDSILKPVLAKLCRSFVIPLPDFFLNGLVSIFVDALGDNFTKILRGSSAFKKCIYNIAYFVLGIVMETDIV